MRKQILVKEVLCVRGFFLMPALRYAWEMKPIEKVRAILELDNWKQERLAEELGVAQSSVHRWLAGAEPRGDKRDAINDLYDRIFGDGTHAPTVPRRPTTTIAGRAGAATDGQIVFAEGQGGLGEVELPPGAAPNSVAIEIEGYSMGFIADGALVFYTEVQSAPSEDMLGQIVVVGLDGGEVLLKRLLRGSAPGLFDLESINGPMMRDRKVEWAAHVDALVPPWRARQLRIDSSEVRL